MKSMACAKFLAGSGPQRICTNAILVIPSEAEGSRCETFKVDSRDVSASLDMTEGG
jgi:hypothetical protein